MQILVLCPYIIVTNPAENYYNYFVVSKILLHALGTNMQVYEEKTTCVKREMLNYL